MIPNFNDIGNLPAGMHQATWEEFYERFGYTPHRRKLLDGLELAMRQLRDVGCTRIWVDGSFVTAKERPGDYDACWLEDGVGIPFLRAKYPVLLNYEDMRMAQKEKYYGELFMSKTGDGFMTFLDFFQQDDRTSIKKGIIQLEL